MEVIGKNNKARFYTGYTNNLDRRIQEHIKGTGAKFCKGKKQIVLKYFEVFLSRKEAMRRELAIKKLSREKKTLLINKFLKRNFH